MLAVIAATIRIASRPSLNTIRAALVMIVPSLAPSPVTTRASSSASSSDKRVSRSSCTEPPSAISFASPSWSRAPYQTSPSTSATRAGSSARS